MPVSRYRSVADMPAPGRNQDDLLTRIRTVWNRAFALTPPVPPRGVCRFATMDEANAAREAAVIGRMRDQRDSR